jgi:hypothetical protein
MYDRHVYKQFEDWVCALYKENKIHSMKEVAERGLKYLGNDVHADDPATVRFVRILKRAADGFDPSETAD